MNKRIELIMVECFKTILIAVAIGIPITSLIVSFSFFLAHDENGLIYIFLPGAFWGTRFGLSGDRLWSLIIAVQVVGYLILAFAIKAAIRRIIELMK
jgi:hypothetical protein